MENKKVTKPKKELKAYLIENGVRKKLVAPKRDTNKLSAIGIWMREHPNCGEILDDKAVMK
jgi:hypothetical protein